MKNSIRVILVVLLAAGMWRCAEQQPENSVPRDVQFTVRATQASKSGRVNAADLPSGTTLLLSIRKSSGEAVLTHERVELLRIGDGYVSKAISLLPGTYSVVDFMLVLGDSVLYATPQAGSPLAHVVTNPLPYSFTVSADALLTLDAEVVATAGTTPEAFGYVAFDIEIKTARSILIAAFAAGSEGQHLIDGEAFILDGYDTLQHMALEPKTNALPFHEDPAATYTLVVLRHGYMRYARNFVYNDLQQELQEGPLTVILTPAFTYVITHSIYTRGDVGTGPRNNGALGMLRTDFGEPGFGPYGWPIGAFQDNSFDHYYARNGRYFISGDGDLDLIEDLSVGWSVDSLDVSHLRRLKRLLLSEATVLRALDLTHNDSLEVLRLTNSTSFRSAELSRTGHIREVQIENTAFTQASVSALIDDVHAAATHNATYNGVFNYTNVATPSGTALDQLRALKNYYGWAITPEP